MRIRSNQIDTELKKKLLPIYFVTGDEPLILQEVLDSIRKQCKLAGYDERKILDVDRKFDWNFINEDANCLSLFADKTLTDLRLGKFKPGVPGGKALQHYCNNLPEDKILIISANKVDASTLKSKWCSTIDKTGAIIQVWPITLEEMPRWIAQRASKLKISLNNEAISLLSERLEGNLLAAQQELEKLKLLFPDKTIDEEDVLESVSDSSKYDVFNLCDACLKGDAKLSIKILNNLRLEGLEVTLALWALSKEVRLLLNLNQAVQKGLPLQSIFKQQRVIQKRQANLSQAANRLPEKVLRQLLDLCKKTDNLMKGVEKGLSPWDVLNDIAILLSGSKLT